MKRRPTKLFLAIILFTPFVLIFISLFIGRYPLSIFEVITLLSEKIINPTSELDTIQETIVFDLKLPRAILGALVGASLAISGTALQGLFRNPLVDSGILG